MSAQPKLRACSCCSECTTDGELLVAGGWDNDKGWLGGVQFHQLWNVQLNKVVEFLIMPPMQEFREYSAHGIVVADNGLDMMIIAGGYGEYRNATDTCEYYVLRSERWEMCGAKLPFVAESIYSIVYKNVLVSILFRDGHVYTPGQ